MHIHKNALTYIMLHNKNVNNNQTLDSLSESTWNHNMILPTMWLRTLPTQPQPLSPRTHVLQGENFTTTEDLSPPGDCHPTTTEDSTSSRWSNYYFNSHRAFAYSKMIIPPLPRIYILQVVVIPTLPRIYFLQMIVIPPQLRIYILQVVVIPPQPRIYILQVVHSLNSPHRVLAYSK